MTKVIVKRKNGKTTFHFGGKPISIDKAYKLYRKGNKFGVTWIPYLTGRDALQAHSPIPPSPTFIPSEIMRSILSYIPFTDDWINAVVSDDVPQILQFIDTYPPDILNMKIPNDRFNNFIPFPMTALEYSQLIIAKLKEWKDSDGLWQVQQGGITSVEFNDKWIKPINDAINDWKNIRKKLKRISKNKGNVSMIWRSDPFGIDGTHDVIPWDLVNILGYHTGDDY